MSDTCKTVRIVSLEAAHTDGFVEINESDFDPAKHELFEGEVLSESFEEAVALLGDAKEDVAKEQAELEAAQAAEAKEAAELEAAKAAELEAAKNANEAWGKTKK